jgi:hypothetical protein
MLRTAALLRPLAVVAAVALTSALPGCGGPKEPEKNVKPGQNLSPEAEAQLKEMQAHYKPIKRGGEEEAEPKPETTKKTKGVIKKSAPGAPKGLILRK